jgi:hypothetical protein
MILLGNDTAMLTAADGTIHLRPTVSDWGTPRFAEATHARLSGALPVELVGTFPIHRIDGNLVVLHTDSPESKRPVGCVVEFWRDESRG